VPSQREIRRRIGSVGNIKQITRAMQFVAASKLKRAQDSTLAARPYSEKIDEVLADLALVGREFRLRWLGVIELLAGSGTEGRVEVRRGQGDGSDLGKHVVTQRRRAPWRGRRDDEEQR